MFFTLVYYLDFNDPTALTAGMISARNAIAIRVRAGMLTGLYVVGPVDVVLYSVVVEAP